MSTPEGRLEALFSTGVRRGLRGKTLKLAPTEAGAPDRLVLLAGQPPLLVELKAPKGGLRAIQRVWHEEAATIGHPVTVLSSEEEVLGWLTRLANALPNLPRVCPNRHRGQHIITRSGKRVCAACKPRASLT
jgi:hypothetical protein